METTKSTDNLKILELIKQEGFRSSSSASEASTTATSLNTNTPSDNLEERFTSSSGS